jgi:broad specificity phosphatase PhoE
MSTAIPTAEYHDLKIQQYQAMELNLLVSRLKGKHRGKTVLVVGHSNTTPALTNLLDKSEDYPRFSELDYTNYYVITIPPKGKARVVKMRF